MTTPIVDSTVIIHYFRKKPEAQAWVDSTAGPLSIVPVTWLEIMQGAGSKAKEEVCKALLSRFEMAYLTQTDQDWAMEQMEHFRLSYGVTLTDCLIASVAHRLQVTLYTHNLKDMEPMIGELAVRPYT